MDIDDFETLKKAFDKENRIESPEEKEFKQKMKVASYEAVKFISVNKITRDVLRSIDPKMAQDQFEETVATFLCALIFAAGSTTDEMLSITKRVRENIEKLDYRIMEARRQERK